MTHDLSPAAALADGVRRGRIEAKARTAGTADHELEQLRAAVQRVLEVCDRWERYGTPDLRRYSGIVRTVLDGPAAPAQPTPCSQPDPCKDGEPCDAHATEQAHAAGDHEYCDITCEAAMPSEQMRNFIIAKGYPGTAGALDELLRRAAAGTSRPASPTNVASSPAPANGTARSVGTVQGRCPACGGESLFLGDGGYVTCRRLDCPQPDAATTLLETPAEVRAATLAEAADAIDAVIDRDRALFPARSSDRAALGAAREIIRNLAAPADRPADAQPQDGPRCVCGDPIEWVDYEDEPGWIHSPGSGTPCLDARPACRWPDCLTPERRRLLDQQVDAGMRGMPTAPIPDQRGACGRADRPADDTQQQETPCICGGSGITHLHADEHRPAR